MKARLAWLRRVGSLGILSAAMFLGPAQAVEARALRPVRLVYFWPVQGFLLIPIFVGPKKGLYEKRGLAVSILLPPDAQTTARMLAVGQGEIAMEPRTDVVFAADIDPPLISIANYDQHNSWCLVGRPGVLSVMDVSPLSTPTRSTWHGFWVERLCAPSSSSGYRRAPGRSSRA